MKGGPKIIERMHEEGLLNNGKSCGYAFALNIETYRGLKTVSHGGSLAGYRSQLLRFPEQQFSVIILANRSDADPSEKAFRIADIFLQDEFLKDPESKENELSVLETADEEIDVALDKSSLPFDEYAGDFYSEELNTTYRFWRDDKGKTGFELDAGRVQNPRFLKEIKSQLLLKMFNL